MQWYCQLKVHNFNITLLVIHTIFKTWVSQYVSPLQLILVIPLFNCEASA
ncbi:Uncharacterized protein APZ42_001023 [Daphnia magna]|uniref:Uncharacterized protein n=1 Tax=Daphnia magna TaxID=35525 RepID=A0A164J7X4_9CRUS|nr:Uncharacterized protein APZ42_001023 [Daphnia magna]